MDMESSLAFLLDTLAGGTSVSLSRPADCALIAAKGGCCRGVWWRVLLGALPRDAKQVK